MTLDDEKNEKVDIAFAFLKETYPLAFRESNQVKALAIGLKKEILAAGIPETISRKALSLAINRYCRQREYQQQLLTIGSSRINLVGEVVDKVTKEQVISLRKSLNKRRAERQAEKVDSLE